MLSMQLQATKLTVNRYLENAEELQKLAGCLHLIEKTPDLVIIDDLDKIQSCRYNIDFMTHVIAGPCSDSIRSA